MKKPRLSFWQIWNMSFGFLGIQFGFALQNANVSRIFETLGASIDEIPILWIAAPCNRINYSTHNRSHERQDMGTIRTQKTVLFGRRNIGYCRLIRNAQLPHPLGSCRNVVDS